MFASSSALLLCVVPSPSFWHSLCESYSLSIGCHRGSSDFKLVRADACFLLYALITVDMFDRFTQGLFVFLRAMQQQIRYPIGFCFDIFLPILSAVFLGLIYHGRVYTPPLITALDPNSRSPLTRREKEIMIDTKMRSFL